MPFVWMEVRCDIQRRTSATVNYRERGACFETWSGMFARNASQAIRAAKSDGWKVKKDQWICPACNGDEDHPNLSASDSASVS